MRVAAATIASRSRVALARATARSFGEHHAEIPVKMLLADGEHERTGAGAEPFETVRFEALAMEEEARFRFQYSEMELSYAATPFLVEHLLEAGFDAVVFLKQETLVLDRLDPVLEMLERHSVVLTPHLLEPATGGGALERERNVLRAGVFNGGVIGFAACKETDLVLEWWKQRVRRMCLLDPDAGLHYEQRWLDFVPSLAPGCGIVRDPGVNVGHWNLPERRIEVRGGRVTACGAPCRVFRFSGYEPERPERITKYNKTATVEEAGDAAEVFARYQRLLEECGWRETRGLAYAWDFFDNGERIRYQARRLYRAMGDEVRRFGDPFRTEGRETFYAWLRARRPEALAGGGRG
jgi:hypothetical protein